MSPSKSCNISQSNHCAYGKIMKSCLLWMFYLIETCHTYDLRFCIFMGCLCVWAICIFVDMHFLSLSFDSFPSVCFLSHFGLLFVHYYYFNQFFPVCILMWVEKKLYGFWRERRWTQSWKMERRNSYPNILYTLKDLFSIIKIGQGKHCFFAFLTVEWLYFK